MLKRRLKMHTRTCATLHVMTAMMTMMRKGGGEARRNECVARAGASAGRQFPPPPRPPPTGPPPATIFSSLAVHRPIGELQLPFPGGAPQISLLKARRWGCAVVRPPLAEEHAAAPVRRHVHLLPHTPPRRAAIEIKKGNKQGVGCEKKKKKQSRFCFLCRFKVQG